MAHLSPSQYDALERAIAEQRRLVIRRRGTEFVVVAQRLRLRDGREVIEAAHPTTGEPMAFRIDELDGIEVIA